jgi:hypothetical protein
MVDQEKVIFESKIKAEDVMEFANFTADLEISLTQSQCEELESMLSLAVVGTIEQFIDDNFYES